MTLEDKFYPDDGSYITKFDNFMIKAAKAVGVAYQNLTGDSYKNLVKTLDKVSALGFGLSVLYGHIPNILLSFLNYKQSKKRIYKTPLEEEIKYEVSGSGRKVGKIIRIVELAVGFSIGAVSVYSNNTELGNNPFIYLFGIGGIISSASFGLMTFADYMVLSDTPNPPDKTLFDKASEGIGKLLSHQPLPTEGYSPVPVENRREYPDCQ